MNTQQHVALSTKVAQTLEGLIQRAETGDSVNPHKLHACWELGTRIPKHLGHREKVRPTTVRQRAHLWALLLWTVVGYARVLGQSKPHVEPFGSRITWFVRTDRNRMSRYLDTKYLRGTNSVCLTDANYWQTALKELADENLEPEEIIGNFVEVAHLVALSHGVSVVDVARLASYDATNEQFDPWSSARRTAWTQGKCTGSDLLSDGCKTQMRGKFHVFTFSSAITEAESCRDEVGPWSYSFTTREGESVHLGYEGMGNPMDGVDERGLVHEGDTFISQENINQGLIKEALGDARKERAERFAVEFELACTIRGDLVQAYKALWVRYRSTQLAIGLAQDHLARAEEQLRQEYNRPGADRAGILKEARKTRVAVQDNGLWSHVYLTRDQFNVLEGVLAARSGLDQRMKDGRLAIATKRLNTKEVLGQAGMPHRVLQDTRNTDEQGEERERWAYTKAFGWGKVTGERHDSKVFKVAFKDGKERKIHVDYLTMK